MTITGARLHLADLVHAGKVSSRRRAAPPHGGLPITESEGATERERWDSTKRPQWRRWLHEPLAHFLVIGALLFLVFEWRGGSRPGSGRIVITPGQIDTMAATFARTWQRPPTELELKGLVDDHVRMELATREAMALGLDRDDTIIRRRLRQKLEFLVEDTVDAAPPTDAELQAWLDAHPGASASSRGSPFVRCT